MSEVQKKPSRIKLDTYGDVISEISLVYRSMRSGAMTEDRAKVSIPMLRTLGEMIRNQKQDDDKANYIEELTGDDGNNADSCESTKADNQASDSQDE